MMRCYSGVVLIAFGRGNDATIFLELFYIVWFVLVFLVLLPVFLERIFHTNNCAQASLER
jgi:hypothetical protein